MTKELTHFYPFRIIRVLELFCCNNRMLSACHSYNFLKKHALSCKRILDLNQLNANK